MPTYNADILPDTTGRNLGSNSLRYNLYCSVLDLTGGTFTYNGALSGISTISASGSITTASQFISSIATGTAPLSVASTTQVTNLNASQLIGSTWAIPGTIGSTTPNTGAFTTLSATGVITSTVSTGTAPFTVASTTKVTNLNADQVDGADWANPAALGSSTPAAVTATTLTANTSLVVGASGSTVTQIRKITASITPAITNANTTSTQTFTFTGAATNDSVCSVDYPAGALGAGLCLGGARVSSANTVELTFQNTTAGGITAASGSYTVTLVRV